MKSEKEFYEFLSDFIKSKRKELNLTNENLSFLTKVDYKTVSQLQNKNTGCNAYNLYKILYVLGLDIFENDSDISINKINKIKAIANLVKACPDSSVNIIEEIVKIFVRKNLKKNNNEYDNIQKI